MKRKTVICFCIFLVIASFTKLAAEEIKVYAPVAQNFLIDEKDYVRYSPVNIFDDNVKCIRRERIQPPDERLDACGNDFLAVTVMRCLFHAEGAVEILLRLPHKFLTV